MSIDFFPPIQRFFIKGTEFFSGSTEFDAKVTSDGELAVTSTERERNVHASFFELAITTDSYFMIVDLSDTTNWPHDATGRIDVSWLKFVVERDATAAGTLQLGVITRIDGTDADIDYLFTIPFTKSDTRRILSIDNFSPSQLKFESSRYITDTADANVAAVNTGGTLDSPNGVTTPAVGDIVIKAGRTAGEYDFLCEILYHGEP